MSDDPMGEAATLSGVAASEESPAKGISEQQARSPIVPRDEEPSEGGEVLEQATRAVLIRLWEKRGEAAPVVPPPNPTTTYVLPEPAWVDGDEVPAEVREREQAALVAKLRGRDPEFDTSLEALRAHRRGEQLPRGWVAAPSGVETAEHAKARQLRERREMGHPDPPQPPFEWTKSHGINDVGFAKEQALKAATLAKPPTTPSGTDQSQGDTPLVSLTELSGRPPEEWRVDGFIPMRGRFVAVSAAAGMGKSYLAEALCLSGVTGEQWLGLEVQPFRSIYVPLEGDYEVAPRAEAWCRYHGYDLADVADGFRIWPTMRVNRQRDWDELCRRITDQRADLVVIDSWRQALGGKSDSDEEAVECVLRGLRLVANETDTTFVILHNTGWAGGRERGSSHFRDEVEVSLVGERIDDDSFHLLTEKNRLAPKGQPLGVYLHNEGGRAVPLRLEAAESGSSPEAQRRQAILSALAAEPGGLTVSALRGPGFGRTGSIPATLETLRAEGLIVGGEGHGERVRLAL